MIRFEIVAPAKLNLGLEVVGRRADGFHDVVTILQALTLADHLTLQPAPALCLTCSDPTLEGEDNLALAALRTLQRELGMDARGWLHLHKSIPAAAGLGGASSDAAAALLLGRRRWAPDLPDERLVALAASLGSDVPFFLAGGTALASGRGDHLEPLPVLRDCWFVVATPQLVIPRKTATLYGALTPADFSQGDRVLRQAGLLRSTGSVDADLLENAFCGPLYRLAPALERIPLAFERAGAPFAALSGAGPSHYTAVDNERTAVEITDRLITDLGPDTAVFTCQPLGSCPTVMET